MNSQPNVFLTGASRGIGRAIALAFAAEGAGIALVGRDERALAAVAREVEARGGTPLPIVADVRDEGAMAAAMARTIDRFGGLDVVVANAGIARIGKVESFALEDFRAQLEVNVLGAFLTVRAALPHLRRAGKPHVFLIGSTCSVEAYPEWSAYCASKFAVLGFSKALRQEVKGDGIRVTDVLPGATATEIFDGLPGDWPREEMVRPDSIAAAVLAAWRLPKEATMERVQITPTSPSL
jgi:NAD(P)-dependent dehydrogenase (short-subunit alcohol dehydrogenase family)